MEVVFVLEMAVLDGLRSQQLDWINLNKFLRELGGAESSRAIPRGVGRASWITLVFVFACRHSKIGILQTAQYIGMAINNLLYIHTSFMLLLLREGRGLYHRMSSW